MGNLLKFGKKGNKKAPKAPNSPHINFFRASLAVCLVVIISFSLAPFFIVTMLVMMCSPKRMAMDLMEGINHLHATLMNFFKDVEGSPRE